MAPNVLLCFRPRFKLFFALLCFCIIFLYILLSSNLLEINVDPNSDAIEVNDGMCKSYSIESLENGKDASKCINPRQFAIQSIRHRHKTTVLTIFTSVSMEDPLDLSSFNSVLHNWGSLKPWINPVLFTGFQSKNIVQQKLANILKLGWHIEKAPRLISNFPVLKDMFSLFSSQSRYHTPFVGYAKPGILFDNSIIETLMYISRIPKDKLEGDGLLLIGRNSKVQSSNFSRKYGNMTFINKLYENGSLNEPSDINYMISTRNGFPWNQLPDFLVNQPGFEKWVAWKALEWNVTVIDVTLSLHSLKQVNTDSWRDREKLKSLCVRKEISELLQKITQGQTICAGYFTKKGFQDGFLRVFKRKSRLKSCVVDKHNEDVVRNTSATC